MKINKIALVVDDEPDLRELISEFLESFGWKVYTAEDGAQAVEVLEEHASEISVLVTDFSMPKMDGLEFLREMRKRSFLNPVLFFSGYGKKEHVVEAMRLGAFDFLDKGFDYFSLLDAVDRAHAGWETLLSNARLLSKDPKASVNVKSGANLTEIAKNYPDMVEDAHKEAA